MIRVMEAVVLAEVGDVARKLLEWETKVQRAHNVVVNPLRHPVLDVVSGYELVIYERVACTLAYHIQVATETKAKRCPDCGRRLTELRKFS